MKILTGQLALTLIIPLMVVSCATTDEVVLDSTKRTPTSSVEVFKDGKLPGHEYQEIAELSFLGPREDELRAQRRFIGQAKKMGGNGLIFNVVPAGQRGGITVFQSTTWVFRGKVIAYSQDTDGSAEAAAYFRGLDIDKIKTAAEGGEPMAQFNLGLAYSTGQKVSRDNSEAVKWFQKAANQQFAFAQNALALMYDEGRGVPKDGAKAMELFLQAGNQGNVPAQTSLGFKYGNGIGVPQDFIEAYKWWSLAAAQGDKTAIENRNRVATRMTSDQIAEGQKRASSFIPKKSD